jgi:hypothetical protein
LQQWHLTFPPFASPILETLLRCKLLFHKLHTLASHKSVLCLEMKCANNRSIRAHKTIIRDLGWISTCYYGKGWKLLIQKKISWVAWCNCSFPSSHCPSYERPLREISRRMCQALG